MGHPKVILTIGALALAGCAPAVAGASAGSGPRETVRSEFTTTKPGAPSGSIYDVTYRNPTNADQNPPAVRHLVLVRPHGTLVDTSVPARCEATDQELQTMGDAACPPKSKVGIGTVTTSVLGGPPSTQPISIFNTADGLIQLVKFQSFGAAVVRSTYHGDTVDTRIPTCLTGGQPPDGCPFDQAVVLASRLDIWKIVVSGRSFVTTPATCPAGGWPTKLTYSYADGAVETVTSTSNCKNRAGRRPVHRPRRVWRNSDVSRPDRP